MKSNLFLLPKLYVILFLQIETYFAKAKQANSILIFADDLRNAILYAGTVIFKKSIIKELAARV